MTETEEKVDRLEQFALARYLYMLLFIKVLLYCTTSANKVLVNRMAGLATEVIKFS